MDVLALLVAILAIAVGLAFTFFGYRLFLILLPLWGAIIGFFFGAHLASVLLGASFLADAVSIIVGILVAILFALLSYLWYWLAVALLAGSVGYSLGLAVMRLLDVQDRNVQLVAALVVAVLFAIVAIWLGLPRYLAIVLTALGGAFTAISGVGVLIGAIPVRAFEAGAIGAQFDTDLSLILFAAAVVLAGVGIFYQIRSTATIEPIGYSHYRNPFRRQAL